MVFAIRGRNALAAVLLLLSLALPVMGRTVLDLDASRQPVRLLDWGDTWIEQGHEARPEQVAIDSSIAWTPSGEGIIYPLTAGKTLWFRFTVPPAPDAERWYLDIPYPAVDLVTLYTQDGLGRWLPQSAGDRVPVADWPVPHRYPLLPVMVSAEKPQHYLLRVRNPHSFSPPLSFVSESYISRQGQRTSLVLGMFFGLIGLAAIVGLLSAVSLHDGAHGAYALTVALIGLSQAAMTGIGGLHLWPRAPIWNDMAPMAIPTLAAGSLLWFSSVAVSLSERSLRMSRLVVGLSLLSVAVAGAIFLVEPSQRFKAMVPYIVAACVVSLAIIYWAARRGDRYAPWLLMGAMPVVIGAAFPLARVTGLIPVSFWTLYGLQIGIAVELPLLLVILMLRSQQQREHTRRVHGLDRIDPATGLINADVFMERLVRMMARSDRFKHQSAVLLIDLVNVDQVKRQFGARAAEELPLLVAGRVLSAAREIDSVARLSDQRFGMLMEGPLTDEDCASAGPRIVARCLMPFKDKPLEFVAQVRVAQTLVPTERADAAKVMERLNAVLAAVPADSKRAVFSLRS